MATTRTEIVSFSLPKELRPSLDAESRRQKRSRSFIVAEAIRVYLQSQVDAAFSAARDQTLREGLALTPADRLRLAEELWQELDRGRKPDQPWVASFATFEEYEKWRRGQKQAV